MAITPARERVRKSRKRRRLGLRTVQVELSEQVIDFLLARKYELERTDNASIGERGISAPRGGVWSGAQVRVAVGTRLTTQ
jgi:hypothetical protein